MSSWSNILLNYLKASASFRVEFNRQLRTQLLNAVEFDLDDEQFSIALDGEIQKSEKLPGVFFINCDLIFPNIFGYPSIIGWRCVRHEHQDFDITRELPKDCQYEFFWMQYPVQELIDYKKGILKGMDSDSLTKAKWPDLNLIIQMNPSIPQNEISKIEKHIGEWVENNNRTFGDQGVIHYIGDFTVNSPGGASLYIDFGSAPVSSSEGLLKELKKNKYIINAYYE